MKKGNALPRRPQGQQPCPAKPLTVTSSQMSRVPPIQIRAPALPQNKPALTTYKPVSTNPLWQSPLQCFSPCIGSSTRYLYKPRPTSTVMHKLCTSIRLVPHMRTHPYKPQFPLISVLFTLMLSYMLVYSAMQNPD